MKDKYLPIKIFEKRKEYDDRSTEGGGGNQEPSFTLHGEELQRHVQYLTSDLQEVRTQFKDELTKQRTLPVIIATSINEAAIAKTHRGQVVNILESDGNDNVVGIFGNRQILSTLHSETVLDNLERIIHGEGAAVLTSSLDEIEIFHPVTDEYEDGHTEYRARLFDYNDFDRNSLARILFESFCRDNSIQIQKKIRFTADMYIYRVTLDSLDKYKELVEFEGLYSVEKTSLLNVSSNAISDDEIIPTKYPEDGADYPKVGVLDTGIAAIGHLSPWLLENEHINYPEEYADRSHGTAVASVLEYSDDLNGTNICSTNGVILFSALVYPKESIFPEDLVDHVREAVERNPDIKIWNMSLGEDAQSDLDSFSEFGMALDNIQDENNVLIVKSAGNCHNFEKGLPKQRISKSADSVRALTVGSIAEKQEEYDYAETNMPSPFSRVGPGPSSIIKPDLVFYGGNAGMHNGEVIEHGVRTFNLNDEDERHAGTSFSTPAVTRIVADLAYMMQEEFDPLMLRALTIHYAKYPAGIQMKMAEKINQMGFGVPVKAQDILYNSPDEITLILRDSLDRGSFIEMFNFPYPTSMVDENGFYRGQIILTLVNKSLVDDKQAGEYCQSNIDVMFGTYDSEKERDTDRPTIINPLGLDGNKNLLNDGLYSARSRGIHPLTGFERECTLVKYGKKFHPVKKYAVDLEEMKPAERERWLLSSRKWYLKIEGLFRDFIEKDAVKRDYQLSQEFCMVLTIRDPLGIAPVYDEVTQQLNHENFIHHDVRVRNIVHVEGSAQ